ncbi:MAG TPA: hypothetical protein VLD85_02325 [Anaeromyxobacteraceae bacterium]|nr:hypothetical protein [Anaeromyxobacteraceae bacterium]
MARLVGFLLCAGALAAAVALVPVRGRTVLERWRAARGPADFVSRSWQEAAAAAGLSGPQAGKPPARAARQDGRRAEPTERHTAADRAEIERIVSERAGK